MIHLIAPAAALVWSLLSYASQVSGLPIPPNHIPPQVTLSATTPDGRRIGRDSPEAAMTDPADGRIYLHAEWSARNGEDRCMLAHELTHWLQIETGLFARISIEEAERQAYRTTLACVTAERLPYRQVAWARAMVAHPHVVGR